VALVFGLPAALMGTIGPVVARMALGDLTCAMRLYERALGLDPQLVEAREHLERVRIRARLTDRTEETPS